VTTPVYTRPSEAASATFDAIPLSALVKDELPDGACVACDFDIEADDPDRDALNDPFHLGDDTHRVPKTIYPLWQEAETLKTEWRQKQKELRARVEEAETRIEAEWEKGNQELRARSNAAAEQLAAAVIASHPYRVGDILVGKYLGRVVRAKILEIKSSWDGHRSSFPGSLVIEATLAPFVKSGALGQGRIHVKLFNNIYDYCGGFDDCRRWRKESVAATDVAA
jgi:hypothetical protein